MAVHHHVVVGSPLHGMQVVVDLELRVVVFATRNDITHITRLYCIVAIVAHELVSAVHVLLVVHDRRRGFMVHHNADALRVSIVIQCL